MGIFRMQYWWIGLFWLLTVPANAHAIWIDTDREAKVGDWHEVRVFFGEPNERNKPTPTERWYSDLNTLSLSLTSPSGKVVVLEKRQAELYYYANFKVEEEGVYTLSINHLVGKVYKRMRLRYQSVAYVSTQPLKELVVMGDKQYFRLGVVPTDKQGREYRAFYSRRKLKGEEVTFDFSVDKSVTVGTDKQGSFFFASDLADGYILNLAKKKKHRGRHNDKKYLFDYIWLTFLEKGIGDRG